MLRKLTPLVLVCAIFAACGDDDGGGDSVSAGDFAKDVCTAARDWVGSLQKGTTEIRSSLDQNASPAEGKKALQGFLTDAVSSTEKFGSDIEAAGVPDVDGGDKAAEELASAADQAKGVMQTAKEQADSLPTNDTQGFVRAAQQLGTSTNKALTEVGNAISDNQAQDLEKAFRDESTCRQISGGSS